MKNKQIIMKHTFFILVFLIMSSSFVYGQGNRLIYPKRVSNATEKTNKILRKSRIYVSADFVEINLEKILSDKQFTIQFREQNIVITKKRIDIRGINSFYFIGGDDNGNRITMSVLEDDIQGTAKQNITTNGTVTINSGSSMNMRAGNSITIQSGFTVQSGASLSITIENVQDCGY